MEFGDRESEAHMSTEEMTEEILEIRNRLNEIETLREQLSKDAFSERADLKDEEHDLRARLFRLQDASQSLRDTEELPGVLGFPPAKPPF
jgi:hypothetical protein